MFYKTVKSIALKINYWSSDKHGVRASSKPFNAYVHNLMKIVLRISMQLDSIVASRPLFKLFVSAQVMPQDWQGDAGLNKVHLHHSSI